MSLHIILVIMILSGITGGSVNYLLPANTDPVSGKKIRNYLTCLVLGISATILVPLFLEFAKSALLDKIDQPTTDGPPLKNYFLFTAYCFLAAAAGLRFINNLMDTVIKDKQIAHLKKENLQVEQKSIQLKKDLTKIDAHNKLRMAKDEKKALADLSGDNKGLGSLTTVFSAIGPVTVQDDPQKGRFGGSPIKNKRQLAASVSASAIPMFYNVKIWVESSDPVNHPLQNDVIFYLHDSFSPSVFTIPVTAFKEGKAVHDNLLAWGAFTVGAVTDGGNTLLELDLSDDKAFPREFRER